MANVWLLTLLLFIHAFHGLGKKVVTTPIVSPILDTKAKEARDRRVAILNFLAGGLAGTISSCVTAPLEVIKTQLQSSRISGKMGPIGVCKELMKSDGPKGFYRGLRPLLVGIIPTRAIYFWAYSSTKNALNSTLGDSPLNHLASAFSAGITSNTITSPLWVVKTRFQILADPTVGQKKYSNYGEVVKAIFREEGPPGFFKGLVASYVGCFEGAIQWITYERTKKLLSSPRVDKDGNFIPSRVPTPLEYFFAAGFSKFVAIMLTYPHEVVRTRMREQATNGAFKYTNFLSTIKSIAKEEGTKGLYGGLGIHVARSVPNAAVMFVTYEIVSKWLHANADKPFLGLAFDFPLLNFPAKLNVPSTNAKQTTISTVEHDLKKESPLSPKKAPVKVVSIK